MAPLPLVKMIDHLLRDIVLEFAVLNAAGITDDMKDQLLVVGDGVANGGKILDRDRNDRAAIPADAATAES